MYPQPIALPDQGTRLNAYLTFDLGTTRLKVAAFDPGGQLLAQHAARHLEHRRDKHIWQSAGQWWQDCIALTPAIMAEAGLSASDILAVGVSGRGGAGIFLDAAGTTVAEPWADNRHAAAFARRLEDPSLSRYAAQLLAKLDWLQAEQSSAAKRVRFALLAKDYLLFRLTGQAITDRASGPDAAAWSSSAPSRILPEPRLPWELAAELSRAAAAELGLKPGTPVAVGAHDGIAANIGAGATQPGSYALTLGTHAVVRTVTDRVPPGSRRFYGFGESAHIIGGNALAAGRSLDWFVDTLADGGGVTTLHQLADAAASVPAGARGTTCLPFLAGEAAPGRRPDARATFSGLSAHTTRAELFRAALEGTAFAIADIVDEVSAWCGEPDWIGLTGSGVQLETWVSILSGVLNRPLTVTDAASEGRGIAMCCAVAVGAETDIHAAAVNMRPQPKVVNAPAMTQDYVKLRASWRELKASLGGFDA